MASRPDDAYRALFDGEREGNIPWGRVGLPEDIARVAVFLASDEAEYMTGQAINVTGGLWMQ